MGLVFEIQVTDTGINLRFYHRETGDLYYETITKNETMYEDLLDCRKNLEALLGIEILVTNWRY